MEFVYASGHDAPQSTACIIRTSNVLNACQSTKIAFAIAQSVIASARFQLSYPDTGKIFIIQGGPQKSKPLQNYQKIVLKHVTEIRFIRQIKV